MYPPLDTPKLDGLALERVMLDCCSYTDDTEVDERDGWIRVSTPSSTLANHNMILRANMAPSQMPEQIAAVQDHYARRGAHYRWIVGPGTYPAALSAELESAGIPLAATLDGMVAEIPDPVPTIPSNLRFELVGEADTRRYADLTASGWGRDFADALTQLSQFLLTCAPVLALQWIVHDEDGPVGTCMLRVLPRSNGRVDRSERSERSNVSDGSLGYLQGAAVLPHARGRGLYRAMTWYRMARLAERGVGRAVVWANRSTSAPIIAALGRPGSTGSVVPSWSGFRTVCSAAAHEV